MITFPFDIWPLFNFYIEKFDSTIIKCECERNARMSYVVKLLIAIGFPEKQIDGGNETGSFIHPSTQTFIFSITNINHPRENFSGAPCDLFCQIHGHNIITLRLQSSVSVRIFFQGG